MNFNLVLTIVFFFAASTIRAEYVDIHLLTPGQLRYSSQNVKEKMNAAIKTGKAIYDAGRERFFGKYRSGKSLFPKSKSFPVIKSPFGYVLVDGHHNVIASIELGICEVPIKVIADFSGLSDSEFWNEAEKNGWVYLNDLAGYKRFPVKDFSQLQDDPNRYFAAITARKYPQEDDLSLSSGADYPLWIKLGKDTPFIEFMISDVLWSRGFSYAYEMGKNPDSSMIEEARQLLLDARIPGLKLVKERTHWSSAVPVLSP